MADRSIKGFKNNFAGAPTVRAEGTAAKLQSFDEITIMSEQPATHEPWAPRGTPSKDFTGSVTKAGTNVANSEGRYVAGHDDTTNLRADNVVHTRATPTSEKGTKSSKPTFKLRSYTDAAGENL